MEFGSRQTESISSSNWISLYIIYRLGREREREREREGSPPSVEQSGPTHWPSTHLILHQSRRLCCCCCCWWWWWWRWVPVVNLISLTPGHLSASTGTSPLVDGERHLPFAFHTYEQNKQKKQKKKQRKKIQTQVSIDADKSSRSFLCCSLSTIRDKTRSSTEPATFF